MENHSLPPKHSLEICRAFDLGERVSSEVIKDGDYHPANLLFRGGEIVGICDWEKAGIAPCSYELARAILYSCFEGNFVLEDSLLDTKHFLTGYLNASPISREQLAHGLKCRIFHMAVSCWIEDMHYNHHNSRANQFLDHEMNIINSATKENLIERIASLV